MCLLQVPYDPVELEMNDATHGLVAPEDFEIPAVSPLWTPMAYAAFDESKISKEVPTNHRHSILSCDMYL